MPPKSPEPKDFLLTTALLATGATLETLDGVQVYEWRGRDLVSVPFQDDGIPYVFYQTAAFPEGSWWIPTATLAPAAWQGSRPLRALGNIPTQHVLRPEAMFWWIPTQDIDVTVSTVLVAGRILDEAPPAPPPL